MYCHILRKFFGGLKFNPTNQIFRPVSARQMEGRQGKPRGTLTYVDFQGERQAVVFRMVVRKVSHINGGKGEG
jgi:hypothetical protein